MATVSSCSVGSTHKHHVISTGWLNPADSGVSQEKEPDWNRIHATLCCKRHSWLSRSFLRGVFPWLISLISSTTHRRKTWHETSRGPCYCLYEHRADSAKTGRVCRFALLKSSRNAANKPGRHGIIGCDTLQNLQHISKHTQFNIGSKSISGSSKISGNTHHYSFDGLW